MNFSHTSLFCLLQSSATICAVRCGTSHAASQPSSYLRNQSRSNLVVKTRSCRHRILALISLLTFRVKIQTVYFSFCHLMKAYPLVASSGGRIGTVSRLFHPGTGSS